MKKKKYREKICDVTPEEFKARRKALRLKAIELAEVLDVTPQYICRVEKGKSKCTRLLDYALTGIEYERGIHVLHVSSNKPRTTQG